MKTFQPKVMNKYFFEVFENIPRQGPGNKESTQRAFRSVSRFLPEHPRILDIGCGKGTQTMDLAELSAGHITAIDNHDSFINHLKKSAEKAGLSGSITCFNADMKTMPFHEKSFDLIWAEGSVFIIGIFEGLKDWKKFLKPAGCIALTDLVWLSDKKPEQLVQFWEKECLYVLSIDEVTEAAKKLNYSPIDHFTLPAEAWLEEYIKPQEKILSRMKKEYQGIKKAAEVIDAIETENKIVRDYLGIFGYEFFMWRLIE